MAGITGTSSIPRPSAAGIPSLAEGTTRTGAPGPAPQPPPLQPAQPTSPSSPQKHAVPQPSQVSHSQSPNASGDAQAARPDKASPSANPSFTSRIATTQAERQLLQQLQARDREVRTHEQAHIAAGGPYVQGGANYTYRFGPDGKMYAVGGEVGIDVAPVPGDPQATIEKAQAIQRAATAPAEPSAQDAIVAAKARAMEMEARAELRQEKTEPISSSSATSGSERVGADSPPISKEVASATSQDVAADKRGQTLHSRPLHPARAHAAQAYSSMAHPIAQASAGLDIYG